MSADDMLVDNSSGTNFIDARIPHIFRIDHDHRAMTTLVHAPRMIDSHLAPQTGGSDRFLQNRMDLKRSIERTCFPARAHEDVALVLTHRTKMSAHRAR